MLAGAGSGKTRVLTTRIAWLIKSGHVTPGGVLAVTFTNKAAREMLTRLTAMLPVSPRGLWIGTFHGLSNRLLRAHHQDAGLPREFQILDTQDQLSAVKRLARSLNVDEDRFPPRDLQRFINSQKEEGLRARDVPAGDDLTRRQVEFFAAYDAQCQREGVADFTELLLRSFELLSRNEVLRQHYQARFRHILVDEFQDTNRLQYRWLKLFAGPESRLFAVGDDDQSIYGFRGANVGNLAEFEKEYSRRPGDPPGAELPLAGQHPRRRERADLEQRASAWARTCGPRPGRATPCACSRARATPTRRASSPRKWARSSERACASSISRCCTARTRSRACWSTPSSARRFPTASTAACAFSSAPR